MFFYVLRSHRVLHEQQLVIAVICIAGRRHHADAGRNATDGDPLDVPATQPQIKIGSVERTGVALGNADIAFRYAKLRDEFCELECERWQLSPGYRAAALVCLRDRR